MRSLKRHGYFITAFSMTVFVFLSPLILIRSSFLSGDYYVQFYPWLKCYSEAVKHFTFPYWIGSMGSGFPLMAEGQIGGFYPLNIVLFFTLPFEAAYNYSIIMHFVIAGLGIYLYLRKMSADQTGGYIAALLFCFGSAYAGCFYNVATLRTLAWFPVVLLLFEHYMDGRKLRFIVFAGILAGMQFLSGFIQMAAYSAFFYTAYLIYRSICRKAGVKDVAKALLALSVISFVIALPQLLLTYQVSVFSNRESATLGFALWRSFLPYGLLGLIFPYSLSSVGADLYVGVLSLLFIIYAFTRAKSDPVIKAMVFILLLSFFFAVGWLNPFYALFLKFTGLYFFRNPSKFLFFGSFALSALAGYGFTKFFERGDERVKEGAVSAFQATIFVVCSLFLLIKIFFVFFKRGILRLGYYIVENFIYNRPHHRYPLDHYMHNVRLFYRQMVEHFSFVDIFVLASWLIILSALIVSAMLFRKKMRNICTAVIFLDLFVFSFYGIGFGGNIRPFSVIRPDSPGIFERLKNDPEVFRMLPFGLKSGKLPNWSLPNANITYGIDGIACYTPLANKNYRERLLGLELIDDSLGLRTPEDKAIDGALDTIRLLNVKYLVTDRSLNRDFLEEVACEDGIILYKLKDHLPRAFFSSDIEGRIGADNTEALKIVFRKDGIIELELSNGRNGFVVFSENYYPGWRVYVDGHEEALIKVKGLVQGVAVKGGDHRIRFVYRPYYISFKR